MLTNFDEVIIPHYAPITARGGKRRTRKHRTRRHKRSKKNRRTRRHH